MAKRRKITVGKAKTKKITVKKRAPIKSWTGSDDARIKKMLQGRVPARTIARTLRRTEGAVRQRVFVIGLSFKGTAKAVQRKAVKRGTGRR